MDELNYEILFDIFSSRLSVKSLLQLRRTSKTWRNMIDDPSFVTAHFTRAYSKKEPGQILLIDRPTKDPSCSIFLRVLRKDGKELKTLIANFKNYDYANLECSCNGLLCFIARAIGYGDYVEGGISSLFVVNPIRKETLILPPLPSFRPQSFIIMMPYGFGHDPSTNTYKIVRSYYLSSEYIYDEGDYIVEIHTLGTSCWRKINEKPPYPLHQMPIFAYGALHWKSYMVRESMFVSFDMANEVFYLTPHPGFRIYQLVDLEGCLGMVDLSSNMRIEIWLLKDCGNGKEREWVKEYRIEIKAPDERSNNSDIEVVGLWENGEILLKNLKGYISYNPKTDGLRYLHIAGLNDEAQVFGYRASLISLSRFM